MGTPLYYPGFFPILAIGNYCIVIIKKPPLRNVNSLIMDPITEIGVAHAVGLEVFQN